MIIARGEPSSLARNILDRQSPGALEHDASLPRERDRVDLEAGIVLSGREENFLSVRRPGEALFASVAAGKDRFLSRPVDDGDGSPVVVADRVVEESDPVALGRDAKVADVAARLVEDLSDRVLEAVFSFDFPDDRETRAVGGPVRLADVLDNLPRRSASQRHPRERAREESMVDPLRSREKQKLSLRRDGQQMGRGKSERPRLRVFGPDREELRNVPLEGRAVDDRLAVRSEARDEDDLWLEGLSGEGHRRLFLPGMGEAPGDVGNRQGEENERRDHDPAQPAGAARGGGRGDGPLRRRHARQLLEIEGEVVRGVEALLGVLLEAVADDPVEPRRDVLVGEREIRRILPQDRRHRLGRRVGVEGAPAREHLVQDRSEGEDVGAGVGGLALHLLRRHVAERAEHDARLGARRGRRQIGDLASLLHARQLGQSEVEDLDSAVLRDEEVLGLQVAVDDPFLVRGRQALRDLPRVVERLAKREAPAGQLRAQGLAFEQLLHDVGRAVVGPDVVNRRDVGMVQEPRRLGLLLEPPQPVRVRREGCRQDLDRDVAGQPRIPRPLHLSHPSRAEGGEDLVGTQAAARVNHKSQITNHKSQNGLVSRRRSARGGSLIRGGRSRSPGRSRPRAARGWRRGGGAGRPRSFRG